MNQSDILTVLQEELGNIAPEAEFGALDRAADIREALDIDSMDFLNFVIAVHRRLKVDIPEIDNPKLVTINGAVDYLMAKLGSKAT
jgi:acyl carrier protein